MPRTAEGDTKAPRELRGGVARAADPGTSVTRMSPKTPRGRAFEPLLLSPETSRKEPESYAAESFDRAFKAQLARATLGISPAGVTSKCFEWLAHLAVSPGKQLQLAEKARRKSARFAIFAASCAGNQNPPPCITPLPQDRRFRHEAWQTWPYNLMQQGFLLTQQWWDNATNDIDGLSRRDEDVISFVTRQMIDRFSPSNFILTNPEVANATLEQGGRNLARGFENFLEDCERALAGKFPVGADQYVVGRDLAITEGKVIYRNRLIEVIQYAPATEKVRAEPILIVPAWIMKFYILDLSPANSMVKYLVERGFTVFMISWRNPTSDDRNLGMDDYLRLGVESAVEVVRTVLPDRKVHAVGYCIGGTLLSIAAAAMARDRDDALKTLTFLTTQADFTEAGELMLLVRESGISYLENMMWDQGYLDTKQMAGAFQILRSNDMIWSRYVREYLLGERSKMSDLMAWNADATRMPYRMHSEYLRKLYLENELAQGRFLVRGRPVTLRDVRTPIFAVATTGDHVAPWRSVYKLHLLTNAELTFTLASGGHNAGIVSEPGHKGRKFQVATRTGDDTYMAPDEWVSRTPVHEGSWWQAWTKWLVAHSEGESEPPPMGAPAAGLKPLEDAPGTYVHQR